VVLGRGYISHQQIDALLLASLNSFDGIGVIGRNVHHDDLESRATNDREVTSWPFGFERCRVKGKQSVAVNSESRTRNSHRPTPRRCGKSQIHTCLCSLNGATGCKRPNAARAGGKPSQRQGDSQIQPSTAPRAPSMQWMRWAPACRLTGTGQASRLPGQGQGTLLGEVPGPVRTQPLLVSATS